jgi:hypothetical protein
LRLRALPRPLWELVPPLTGRLPRAPEDAPSLAGGRGSDMMDRELVAFQDLGMSIKLFFWVLFSGCFWGYSRSWFDSIIVQVLRSRVVLNKAQSVMLQRRAQGPTLIDGSQPWFRAPKCCLCRLSADSEQSTSEPVSEYHRPCGRIVWRDETVVWINYERPNIVIQLHWINSSKKILQAISHLL